MCVCVCVCVCASLCVCALVLCVCVIPLRSEHWGSRGKNAPNDTPSHNSDAASWIPVKFQPNSKRRPTQRQKKGDEEVRRTTANKVRANCSRPSSHTPPSTRPPVCTSASRYLTHTFGPSTARIRQKRRKSALFPNCGLFSYSRTLALFRLALFEQRADRD